MIKLKVRYEIVIEEVIKKIARFELVLKPILYAVPFTTAKVILSTTPIIIPNNSLYVVLFAKPL